MDVDLLCAFPHCLAACVCAQDTGTQQMVIEEAVNEALETDNLALQNMSGSKYVAVRVNPCLNLDSQLNTLVMLQTDFCKAQTCALSCVNKFVRLEPSPLGEGLQP